MKIIRKTYYNKERTNDIMICENITDFYGGKIVEFLNSEIMFYSTFEYELVSDGYVLFVSAFK